MKRIVTVQDLIDELMLVSDKSAEVNIAKNDNGWEYDFTPNMYDFSVIDEATYNIWDKKIEERNEKITSKFTDTSCQ